MARRQPKKSDATHSRQRMVLLALYWPEELLMRGIVDYARSRGWRLLDLSCYSMDLPRSFRPDGVIFYLHEEKVQLARRLLRLGVATVQIQDLGLRTRCPCVVRDTRAIGRAAAEHFARRGFRRMAYVHSEAWQRPLDDPICESFLHNAGRLGASARAFCLQDHGRIIPWKRDHVFAGRLRKELASIEPPVGIFTYYDAMAARICHYCEEIGLMVPEQVAVLGRGNNTLVCDCAPVPLSSVDPNVYEQGRVAAELLDGLMDGKPAPKEPFLIPPMGVVGRQSTDVLAVPNVDTAMALRYMWEHLDRPLCADDVARAVGVSRRKLYQDFRIHLGRSVIEELNRKRIERCCELLTSTRQSVVSIARQVGFRTEPYMYPVFRKHVGMTPRQYRLAHTAKSGQGEDAESAGRQ